MRFFLILLFLQGTLFAFDHSPFFGKFGEFSLSSSYAYQFYPRIDRAIPIENNSLSHNHFFTLNLSNRFLPNWEGEIEVDFAATTQTHFGLRRAGAQIRYLFFDDLAGDFLTLVVGGQGFYVTTKQLQDPTTPYHGQGNGEVGVSIGKEWHGDEKWVGRFFGFVGAGLANRGFPWVRVLAGPQLQWNRRHQLETLIEGYFGFGNQNRVSLASFLGYGKIDHRSMDLSIAYSYFFGIFGKLEIRYGYRFYAYAFPEKAHTATLAYTIPFSLF